MTYTTFARLVLALALTLPLGSALAQFFADAPQHQKQVRDQKAEIRHLDYNWL